MKITYDPLWETIAKKNMRKKDLRIKSGITENCLASLGKNMNISMANLYRICKALNCTPNDVFKFTFEEDEE